MIEIRETKKKDKKIGSNVFWDIIVEGEKRGEIQNDLSWKNTRALKEKTILRYGETYYYSSFVIGSETKIENKSGQTIAIGKRIKLWTYKLEFVNDLEDLDEVLLFLGFVIFNYFHQK
ncbi:hypothetical protein J2S00_003628 [Caldalkalibacillus uzonensis]|uniref:Uncharacterized protein n=1 Tax=Caldalkalibacillus uzonensis TaxID=353224 RepID=A0ABU0CX61_9BACI|nr:hypothetical protein [Caldalkalibacillus uzonensis]MDQ0340788.1 hypothetical protein [Caldalkalibacillus uzonensis]